MKNIVLRKFSGFTLIELLVVVSVISILATVVSVNMGDVGSQGRDAKRQSDLRNLQTAVEMYKQKNGRYPDGCNGPDVWSGQKGSGYDCSGGSGQYISSLAPEFISVLPVDKKLNTSVSKSGYAYIVNANGTVYKIIAMNTVEAEEIDYNYPLKSCDVRPDPDTGGFQSSGPDGIDNAGWCAYATRYAASDSPEESDLTSYDQLEHCKRKADGGNGRFDNSFAVWGGFEKIDGSSHRASQVRYTTKIICK